MTSPSPDSSPTRQAAVVAIGAIVLALHAWWYFPHYSDDALISLRYAARLLDGHGLTWTAGPPVEGYSNLLWVLACAALGRVGVDLITATWILGALGSASVLGALWFRCRDSATVVPLALAVAVWVLFAPVAVWTLAGLEAALVAGLLAWALVLLLDDRPALLPGVLLGLLALTRVDGALFAVAVALVVAIRGSWRRAVALVAPAYLLLAAQLVFRKTYYGEWLPNVAFVKGTLSTAHIAPGLRYIGGGLAALMPVSLVVVIVMAIFVARDRARRATATLLLAIMLAWLGYVAVVGGDIFAAWRHMIPVAVVMALGAALAAERLPSRPALRSRWLAAIVSMLVWFGAGQFINDGNRRAKQDVWVWNAEPVGRALRAAFGDTQPLLAVTAAGGLPYWSRLPCLDMLGLNDAHIARTRPRGHEGAWIGHGRADADYLMERRPDLIQFGTAGGSEPVFLYKEQLAGNATFQNEYTLCRLAGTDPFPFITHIYVDRHSPKVGIDATADEVRVPPYLLNAAAPIYARLDADDDFTVAFEPGTPLAVERLEVQAGTWEIVEPAGPIDVGVTASDGAAIAVNTSGDRPAFRVGDAEEIAVRIESAATTEWPVYGLVLRRVGP